MGGSADRRSAYIAGLMYPGGYFPSIAERIGLVPRGSAAQASRQAQQNRLQHEWEEAALNSQHAGWFYAPAWQPAYGMPPAWAGPAYGEEPQYAAAPAAMAPRTPSPARAPTPQAPDDFADDDGYAEPAAADVQPAEVADDEPSPEQAAVNQLWNHPFEHPELEINVPGSLFTYNHRMDPRFERGFDSTVHYFSEGQRRSCKLSICSDGTLRDCDGNLFDTRNATRNGEVTGSAIYVLEPDGHLYSWWAQGNREIHHSSLTAGGPVACAGEIVVHDGILAGLSNDSGHYLPERAQLAECFTYLTQMGLQRSDDFWLWPV